MYHVLLVDDEASVTDSLRCSIDWGKYDLEVAAAVPNGERALDVIRQQPIDIVITDIRMAKTGGLELCQQISSMNRNIQTIIMSGYAEFSYAQKAINYGVVGYCLKPVEYDEIIRHLVHAVQRLKATARLPDYDNLLDALQNGDADEIDASLQSFGFTAARYYAAVSVGSKKIELQEHEGLCLQLGRKQFAYITAQELSQAERTALLAHPKCRGFSSSSRAVPISELSDTIKRLNHSAFNYFIDPSRKIFDEKTEDHSASLLQQVYYASVVGDRAKILELLDEIRGCADRFTVRSALRLYNIIFSSDFFAAEQEDGIYTPQQLCARYRDFSSMLASLRERLAHDSAPVTAAVMTNSGIVQIMAYINTHFDQEISLGQLAERFHMNPNYLCQMFRKETGKNFARYVTELRIVKAKELLDSSHYSISEVATKVGYNDYFYFLKTFKRITGTTPKQYRMSEIKGEHAYE